MALVVFISTTLAVLACLGFALWRARSGQPQRLTFLACAAAILIGLVTVWGLLQFGGAVDDQGVVREHAFGYLPLGFGLIMIGIAGLILRLFLNALASGTPGHAGFTLSGALIFAGISLIAVLLLAARKSADGEILLPDPLYFATGEALVLAGALGFLAQWSALWLAHLRSRRPRI